MQIHVIAVGKIKEKYLSAGIEEYVKRLTPYCRLENTQLEEERMPDNPSPAEKSHIIGGAFGLSPQVLAAANERLSFSKMTFTHQMIRMMLVEQIYRAFKTQKGTVLLSLRKKQNGVGCYGK